MAKERTGAILAIVATASALGPFSNTIYAPTLPAVRDTFQTTNVWAGATVSSYAFVLALSQFLAGPVADRFSARRVLIGGLLLYSGASVLAYLAPSVEVFLVARALQAAGAATGLVTGGAIVADRYPPEARARPMAALQTFNAIGGSLGPVVGSALGVAFAWQSNSLALVAAGLGLALAAALGLPDLRPPAQRLTFDGVAEVLRFPVTAGVVMLGCLQFFGQFVFVAYMPLVLRELARVPEAAVGVLFLPQTGGVLVGSHLGGRLAERYGPRPVLAATAWLTCLFTLLYAGVVAAPPGDWMLAWLTLFNAAGAVSLGLGVPAQLTTMVERFSAKRGAAVGTYASLRYLGAAAGPLVAGAVLDHFGVASGFGVAAAAMGLGAVVAQALLRPRRA